MRKVELLTYNTEWPSCYAREKLTLIDILAADLVSIYHIGSTSVPGLKAKPIIDILAVVRDIEKLDNSNDRMILAGYTPKGEYGISGRRYFFKGTSDRHSFHLHAFQDGNPQIERHIRFRDYLRSHPVEAQEYEMLKENLAERFPDDINAYTDGKDVFIKNIDKKAAAVFRRHLKAE